MTSPENFHLLAGLLKQRSGITLAQDKDYLIESRLLPVARGRGMQDVAELCIALRGRPPEELLVEITEAMTTNESSFFRDIRPYEQLRQVLLPMLMQARGQKRIRIWSAACSTGQEPYSICMCIEEDRAAMPGWEFEIIATDLAGKVIEKAKQGIYSQFEVQRGLPIQMLIRHFTNLPDTRWQLADAIRSQVQFKLQNLLDDYAPLGKFDLIFCRNVLIYFDDSTKAHIAAKMAQALAPGGILVLGATETLMDAEGRFRAVEQCRGAYALK